MENFVTASPEIETGHDYESADIETGHGRNTKHPYSALANDITRKLDELHSESQWQRKMARECCIYRVPEKVRKINEAAYTPRIVSIGPYHHGNDKLQFMEAYKLKYFKKFLEKGKVGLEQLVEDVKRSEKTIRNSYADFIEMESDDFVTMILVDSGFVIELLFSSCIKNNDVMFPNLYMETDLIHDLILLENQIPFIVLERLFTYIDVSAPCEGCTLLDLACHFFRCYNRQNQQITITVKHFTDLIRIFHLPAGDDNRRGYDRQHKQCNLPLLCQVIKIVLIVLLTRRLKFNKGEVEFLDSATDMHLAGMKFSNRYSTCLFDIQFSNGVLSIPCFKLDDRTVSCFRNLVALEFCHYPNDSRIIDYVHFMDYLINTSKDVDLLVKKGIIVNLLGDGKEAATFFNNLCTNVSFTRTDYFSDLYNDLNAYCKDPKNRWGAIFQREYFSNPWRTASTIAAIILLLLTATQTVCSIISLKPYLDF